jgi:hypothetical protein
MTSLACSSLSASCSAQPQPLRAIGVRNLLLRPIHLQPLASSASAAAPLCPSPRSRSAASSVRCQALDPKDSKQSSSRGGSSGAALQFNPTYAVIVGVFAALFLFRNPYLFAALSILTIIPQNSAVTSLNSLVLIFYDSGLFMNFAEAVYCVRLISWLSIACTLISFAIFA